DAQSHARSEPAVLTPAHSLAACVALAGRGAEKQQTGSSSSRRRPAGPLPQRNWTASVASQNDCTTAAAAGLALSPSLAHPQPRSAGSFEGRTPGPVPQTQSLRIDDDPCFGNCGFEEALI
uniref:Uncharacterized protein n=1 Tax=Mustela putorius furo TaxID=9669 RepID=M3Y264_MUSPF